MPYDPLDPVDLLHDELAQRRETGYLVDDAAKRAADLDPADRAAHLALVDELAEAERAPGWRYEEPDLLPDILDTLPVSSATKAPADVADRISAGWSARIAGNNVGKPVENGDHWTPAHLRSYLELADAWPLRDYVPLLEPMPAGYELRDCWPETVKGRIDGAARDDDVDYSILALHLLERHGHDLTAHHVAASWLELLPVHQVFTAERAAYRNLVNGVPIPRTATYRNPHREWIGAQIRGDAYGWVTPGNPRAAAVLAYEDASLSHVGNGIYGEMWAAALVAAAFTAGSARACVEESLRHVPPRSRTHEAVARILDLHTAGGTFEDAVAVVHSEFGQYCWIHTINNAALVAAGILWGDGDVAATIGLTVQGGLDTDSNGATVGSVVGVLSGTRALPPHLVDPLRDSVRSALFGFDGSRISDLAARTTALARTHS